MKQQVKYKPIARRSSKINNHTARNWQFTGGYHKLPKTRCSESQFNRNNVKDSHGIAYVQLYCRSSFSLVCARPRRNEKSKAHLSPQLKFNARHGRAWLPVCTSVVCAYHVLGICNDWDEREPATQDEQNNIRSPMLSDEYSENPTDLPTTALLRQQWKEGMRSKQTVVIDSIVDDVTDESAGPLNDDNNRAPQVKEEKKGKDKEISRYRASPAKGNKIHATKLQVMVAGCFAFPTSEKYKSPWWDNNRHAKKRGPCNVLLRTSSGRAFVLIVSSYDPLQALTYENLIDLAITTPGTATITDINPVSAASMGVHGTPACLTNIAVREIGVPTSAVLDDTPATDATAVPNPVSAASVNGYVTSDGFLACAVREISVPTVTAATKRKGSNRDVLWENRVVVPYEYFTTPTSMEITLKPVIDAPVITASTCFLTFDQQQVEADGISSASFSATLADAHLLTEAQATEAVFQLSISSTYGQLTLPSNQCESYAYKCLLVGTLSARYTHNNSYNKYDSPKQNVIVLVDVGNFGAGGRKSSRVAVPVIVRRPTNHSPVILAPAALNTAENQLLTLAIMSVRSRGLVQLPANQVLLCKQSVRRFLQHRHLLDTDEADTPHAQASASVQFSGFAFRTALSVLNYLLAQDWRGFDTVTTTDATLFSDSSVTRIVVDSVNDAPVVRLAELFVWVPKATPVVIPSITVSDADLPADGVLQVVIEVTQGTANLAFSSLQANNRTHSNNSKQPIYRVVLIGQVGDFNMLARTEQEISVPTSAVLDNGTATTATAVSNPVTAASVKVHVTPAGWMTITVPEISVPPTSAVLDNATAASTELCLVSAASVKVCKTDSGLIVCTVPEISVPSHVLDNAAASGKVDETPPGLITITVREIGVSPSAGPDNTTTTATAVSNPVSAASVEVHVTPAGWMTLIVQEISVASSAVLDNATTTAAVPNPVTVTSVEVHTTPASLITVTLREISVAPTSATATELCLVSAASVKVCKINSGRVLCTVRGISTPTGAVLDNGTNKIIVPNPVTASSAGNVCEAPAAGLLMQEIGVPTSAVLDDGTTATATAVPNPVSAASVKVHVTPAGWMTITVREIRVPPTSAVLDDGTTATATAVPNPVSAASVKVHVTPAGWMTITVREIRVPPTSAVLDNATATAAVGVTTRRVSVAFDQLTIGSCTTKSNLAILSAYRNIKTLVLLLCTCAFAGNACLNIAGRCGRAFPDVDLAGFTSGTEGFRMVGAATDDSYGWFVSGIGDVNGDGIDDVAVCGPYADPPGRTGAGAVMVIYGRSTATDTAFSEVSAAAVPSGSGFMIYGAAAGDNVGWGSVAAAGDMNGDDIGDFIFGARLTDPDTSKSATAYVLFGRNASNPFPDVVDLASFVSGAATGFKITGAAVSVWLGISSSGAGDMNGDGYDDIVIGAHNAGFSARTDGGAAYVIFGHSTATSFTDIVLDGYVTGTIGFRMYGAAANHRAGWSVGGAGDYNGDGYADVIVGAPNASPSGRSLAGISYVIFGHSGAFADIDLLSFTAGTSGFRIMGAQANIHSGRSVSGAGDVNGDGYDDVVVGAPIYTSSGRVQSGASYVIFGRRGVPAFADADLATMVYGTLGFRIFGATAWSELGIAVSGAGDVNGDGIDDLVVGAYLSDALGRIGAGSAVVIFGHSNSTTFPDIDTLSTLGELGYRIYGAAGGDRLGLSIDAAGDVNNDGIDDIIVGAHGVDVNSLSNVGATYVKFGSYATPTSQPSLQPSSQPSRQPTRQPSMQPTQQPSAQPTRQPSSYLSAQPSCQPSMQPSAQPSRQPSVQPSSQPTQQPSAQPTRQPSSYPSAQPSSQPSMQPSAQPSRKPSAQRTRRPTSQPSHQPSSQPSLQPSKQPYALPSSQPTRVPTKQPSGQPSSRPTMQPSAAPSGQPSEQPSSSPSAQPSGLPSTQPVSSPSAQPSCQPSQRPSSQPSVQPTLLPSAQPTQQPSSQPSSDPSVQPSAFPSAQPSSRPSVQPSSIPSMQPSMHPTTQPSASPSSQPSNKPSSVPSGQPSLQPSTEPSVQPTMQPTSTPSFQSTAQPSAQPTVQPSGQPSTRPSTQPNAQPTVQPSSQPSRMPTVQPSVQPSCIPTLQQTRQPTNKPTSQPTSQPSQKPSMQPSTQPTAQPSRTPTEQPSTQPTSAPSGQPSQGPTGQLSELPTQQPSAQPSCTPSSQPTGSPTSQPSVHPSGQPSELPTRQPTQKPSSKPSFAPSHQLTAHPSSQPTETPTGQPSTAPSILISIAPSSQPTEIPSAQPFARPSSQPTCQPSVQPSSQPSRAPSAMPTAPPSSQPISTPTSFPSSQPSVQPSAQPSTQPSGSPFAPPSTSPTSQPSTLPTSLPSSAPTSAPTVAPPSGEWVTLLSAGSSLHLLTEINGDVVAGGSSANPGARVALMTTASASCFWFDGVTGTLKGKYMFPWEFTTALSTLSGAHGKQQLLVSGTTSFPPRSYVAICNVEDPPQQQKLICSTTVVPSMMATSTVSNPNAKAILSIGSWLGVPALVIFDADGAYVGSFSYSNSQLLEYTFRLTAMGVVSGFFGSCVAGINSQTDGSQQIVIGWADSYRSIIPPLVVIPQSGKKIVNYDKLVQCAILLPGVFHSVVGGGISLEGDSLGTQPYIVRTNTLLAVLMFGFRYVASGSQSHINDMVLVGGHIFLIADAFGLAPQPSRHYLFVLQIVAATGEIHKQVRVSGPGDLICSKIQLAQNRLLLGCNIYTGSDSQALLLSASQDLKFFDLPPGYERQQLDDEFLAISLPFAIVSKNALTSQPLSPQVSRLHFNITQGSFVQEVTSRPPSLAPTRLPTAAPTTLPPTPTPTTYWPSSQPSGRPSSQPSRQPSSRPTARPTFSARPTSAPSSSTPTSTHRPTMDPSSQPTGAPSTQPSAHPSAQPSAQRVTDPTCQPSGQPSQQPLSVPTSVPSAVTTAPTLQLTERSSGQPQAKPTAHPTTTMLRTTWPTTSTSLSDEHSTAEDEPSYALAVGVVGAGALSLLLLVWLAYRWAHAKKRNKEVFLKVVPSSDESAPSPTALGNTAPVIQQSSVAVDELQLVESGGESQVDSESESIDLSSEDTASSYSNDAVTQQGDLSSDGTASSGSVDEMLEQGDLSSNGTASSGSVLEQGDLSDNEQ